MKLNFSKIIPLFSLILCASCSYFSPNNGSEYDPSKCTKNNTALTGKKIYWLGSSVTLGMESKNTALAEYIDARNGSNSTKEAVSGTTLRTKDCSNNYVKRMVESSTFDKSEKIDFFICQLSTNDCKEKFNREYGVLTAESKINLTDFDTSTTVGAMEYIVRYASDTWKCPVYFYTNAYFSDSGEKSIKDTKGSDYNALISIAKDLAIKWNKVEGVNVDVIDIFNDKAFNDISSEKYRNYMCDAIHPYRRGYLEWRTPKVEEFLLNKIG